MEKSLYSATFLTFLFFGVWISATDQNQLCKIYHHDLHADHHDTRVLEIAKIVFYFSKEPEVRLVSEKQLKEQKKEMVFLCPLTSVKAECEKKLQKLCSNNHHLYEIKGEIVHLPTVSLRFTIAYNPQKVEMAYDSFDSIGMYKGLVFTFYDKTLLEKIKEYGKPLIQTVSTSKRPSVIIDCGHGGDDTGTVGFGDIKEKDITLQIGLKVATLLRCNDLDVILTRNSDMFVPLDRRTHYARNRRSDQSIFISIHTNSSNNEKASGIETFCLSPPLLCHCFSTMDEYTARLLDDISCELYVKSNMLANYLHYNVLSVAHKKNPYLNDRHIKHAVSQVLMGTVVPSALIELGFLSNRYEAAFLKDSEYQSELAYGICLAVFEYFTNLKGLS